MKTRHFVFLREARKFTRALLLLLFIVPACLPRARAGLTVDIHTYRDENSHTAYAWLGTNAVAPAAPLGNYLIRSPHYPTNGTYLRYSHTGTAFTFLEGGGSGTGNFDTFMSALTNGPWSIQVTNAASTNDYTFNVTASGLSSNLLRSVSITYPVDGDTNVPTNPAFTWAGGPVGWLGTLDVEVYDDPFNYYEYESIAPTETSWNSPTPLPVGTNEFYIAYRSNATASIVASTPTNGATPISGWVSTANIEVTDLSRFITQDAVASSGESGLVAHYRFDNPVLLGADSSTNGYDLNVSGSWNGGDVFDTTDAVAGGGAVEFFTDGNVGGAFLSYNPTPAELLSVLSSNFSISLWIKTTQNFGNPGDFAYDGAGVLSADIPGTDYDVLPLALTGGEAAFNSGGPGDYTINSTTNVNDGNYHHIVVTRNQATGEKKIYIDGALNISDFDSGDVLDSPALLSIGAIMDASVSDPNSAGPYNGYEGLLDDLQIYSTVLSGGQAAYLFAHPGLIAPASTNPPVDVAMQISLVRNQDLNSGDTYACYPYLLSVNIPEVTEHRVESPNGLFNGSLTGSGSYLLFSLDAVLDECTNGLWKLYINKTNANEQVFTFRVMIDGVDTNFLKRVTILSPTNGSVNVPVNPTFSWTGPTGFSGVFAQKYEPTPYNNVVSTNMPGSPTNWPSPPTLNPGTNRFYLSVYTNNCPLVTFTTPLDVSLIPINGWTAVAHLNSDATSQFNVTSLPTPVQLMNAQRSGTNIQFQFLSQPGTTNIVQSRTNVATGSWQDRTNFFGDGTLKTVVLPLNSAPREFFRIITQ